MDGPHWFENRFVIQNQKYFQANLARTLILKDTTKFSKVSLLGVYSLWGDCTVYSGRLGIIVVDLCYLALFEDFSL